MEEERKVNRLLRDDPENDKLNDRLQQVITFLGHGRHFSCLNVAVMAIQSGWRGGAKNVLHALEHAHRQGDTTSLQ